MQGYLADLVVAVHAAYVSFVVGGLVLILIGGWRGWAWVRNPIFRVVHLIAILYVAGEAALDMECPLTEWEYRLRKAAGQDADTRSFVGRVLHEAIFVDLPDVALRVIHITFALLVASSLWLVPPRWKRR